MGIDYFDELEEDEVAAAICEAMSFDKFADRIRYCTSPAPAGTVWKKLCKVCRTVPAHPVYDQGNCCEDCWVDRQGEGSGVTNSPSEGPHSLGGQTGQHQAPNNVVKVD